MEREEEQRIAREKKASEEARKQEEMDRRQREVRMVKLFSSCHCNLAERRGSSKRGNVQAKSKTN